MRREKKHALQKEREMRAALEKRLEPIRKRREEIEKQLELMNKGIYPTRSKHLSPKELMEKETEWECLEILAFEDLYTVRHMRGKKYGLESYFVMLGGTILSRHDNEKDAMEQFDARLAGYSAVRNDTWEIDDFQD